MRILERIAASPSKTLLAVLSAFVGGILLHAWDERVWMIWAVWAACAAVCLVAAFFARRAPSLRLPLFIVAAFLLALARYDAALAPRTSAMQDGAYHGIAAAEPRRKGRSILLTVNGIVAPDGSSPRRMTLVFRTMPEAHEGDAVAWRCATPPTEERPACIVAGDVAVADTGPHPIVFLRARLRTVTRSLMPEPDASLLLGLLAGDRDGLPADLLTAFRDTGTTHVLAASGYNVMLVVEAAVILFAMFGLPRRRAAFLVAACVFLFAALCGGDPPVARAALMGSTGLLAAALGRRYHAPNALMLAAACMLAIDPAALRHDAGFRLSFAAVAGLRAFGQPFAKRLAWLPWDGVRRGLAETLGAIVATLPLILHDFGIFAVSAPLVNLAIVPLIPFAMATGAAAIVAEPLTGAASPFAVVAAATLRLMRCIVSASADAIPALGLRVGILGAAILYGWIFLLWYGLRRREDDIV